MSNQHPDQLSDAQKIQILLRNYPALLAEFVRIQAGHARYETLRTLNPRQFADLYAKNIKTSTPFDELVEGLV